jgi:hypothetical protein
MRQSARQYLIDECHLDDHAWESIHADLSHKSSSGFWVGVGAWATTLPFIGLLLAALDLIFDKSDSDILANLGLMSVLTAVSVFGFGRARIYFFEQSLCAALWINFLVVLVLIIAPFSAHSPDRSFEFSLLMILIFINSSASGIMAIRKSFIFLLVLVLLLYALVSPKAEMGVDLGWERTLIGFLILSLVLVLEYESRLLRFFRDGSLASLRTSLISVILLFLVLSPTRAVLLPGTPMNVKSYSFLSIAGLALSFHWLSHYSKQIGVPRIASILFFILIAAMTPARPELLICTALSLICFSRGETILFWWTVATGVVSALFMRNAYNAPHEMLGLQFFGAAAMFLAAHLAYRIHRKSVV